MSVYYCCLSCLTLAELYEMYFLCILWKLRWDKSAINDMVCGKAGLLARATAENAFSPRVPLERSLQRRCPSGAEEMHVGKAERTGGRGKVKVSCREDLNEVSPGRCAALPARAGFQEPRCAYRLGKSAAEKLLEGENASDWLRKVPRMCTRIGKSLPRRVRSCPRVLHGWMGRSNQGGK